MLKLVCIPEISFSVCKKRCLNFRFGSKNECHEIGQSDDFVLMASKGNDGLFSAELHITNNMIGLILTKIPRKSQVLGKKYPVPLNVRYSMLM